MSKSTYQIVRVCIVLTLLLCIGSTNMWGWYVAGSAELVNSGYSWSLGEAADEMTNISGDWYVLSVPNKTHAAGATYNFKAYETNDWDATQIPSDKDMWYYSDAAGTREVTILINSSGPNVYSSITAAGSEDVFGSSWSVAASTGNDLVFRDGLMTLTKTGVALTAGTTYSFKLVANRTWGEGSEWPTSNYALQVPEDGTYDITINFDITTGTITVVPCLSTVKYYLIGDLNGGEWSTQATNEMTAGTDGAGNTIYYKPVTAAGEFLILVGCNGWSTGAFPITRNYTHVNNAIPQADISLTEGTKDSRVSTTATSGYIVYYPATNEICATTDLSKLGKRWQIQYSLEEWSPSALDYTAYDVNAVTGDSVTFTLDLAASTTYRFYISDLLDVVWWGDKSDGNITSSSKNRNVQATTEEGNWSFWMESGVAGRYYITFNITTHKLCVYYPYAITFDYVTGCSSTQGSIGAYDHSKSEDITSGNGVGVGAKVGFWGYANTDYELVGFYSDATGNTQLADGSSTYDVNSVTSDLTVYIKFEPAKLIIYRTGDKEDDARAISESVETYAGGTVTKPIEFRMKVRELDHWYSLCLPFEVSAVKVWDAEDGVYYDLIPYYRSSGTFYTGHYVIRTPELTNDSIATTNFGNWSDPSYQTAYSPSPNTPYIIQWHHSYFESRYVSFFGEANQTIPAAMTVGNRPKSKNWVTVYGNNAMTDGTVEDAYTLNGDESWERPVDKGKDVTIHPFECYIRANSEVTSKFLVLRRGMNFDETPTGFESINVSSPVTSKVLVGGQLYIFREGKMYNMHGVLIREGKEE